MIILLVVDHEFGEDVGAAGATLPSTTAETSGKTQLQEKDGTASGFAFSPKPACHFPCKLFAEV